VTQEGRKRTLHPAQIVVIAFGAAVIVGTILLLLPFSTSPGKTTDFVTAFFTAVSAVCITGLTVVETGTHWSPFGQFVILLLIQLGGLGIVAFAAIYLISRLHLAYGESLPDAIWNGIFHAIAAFNNAGFSLYQGSMSGFATDLFIIAPILIAVVVGGLGFPVLIELHERIWRLNKQSSGKPKRFSLHTRLTLGTTAVLLFLGGLYVAILEWNNPSTLGPLGTLEKIANSIFMGAMPRSGGFSSLDVSQMDPATWLGMNLLMFIGGGSASTAGGIKVTTVAILIFIIYTEIRGETAVNVGNRRLPRSIQRQALTLVALYASVIIVSTVFLSATTKFDLDNLLFEVISAAATVGLSTGITSVVWAL